MRSIINSDGVIEYVITQEEKEIFDIAVNNLAVSTGIRSVAGGVNYE